MPAGAMIRRKHINLCFALSSGIKEKFVEIWAILSGSRGFLEKAINEVYVDNAGVGVVVDECFRRNGE